MADEADDAAEETHSPSRFGRGRMDSIAEDDGNSSLNSEDRQVIAKADSSEDDEPEERDENIPAWGRTARQTARWPATPEAKTALPPPSSLFPREPPEERAEGSLAIGDPFSSISEDDIDRKKTVLTKILRALSTRFESVGYCQGMDRIVVHVMRAARCAVSLRSVPLAERPQRDQIADERARQCYSFLEGIFLRLSLSGPPPSLVSPHHCL
jgi:hypothetical protein